MYYLDHMVSCNVHLASYHQQKQQVFRHYFNQIYSMGLSFELQVVGLVSLIYFPFRTNKRRSFLRLPHCLFSLNIQLLQPKTYKLQSTNARTDENKQTEKVRTIKTLVVITLKSFIRQNRFIEITPRYCFPVTLVALNI